MFSTDASPCHVPPGLSLVFSPLCNHCFRAVPEIILGGDGPQTLFCPVGGGCFVDNVSEGWGVGR